MHIGISRKGTPRAWVQQLTSNNQIVTTTDPAKARNFYKTKGERAAQLAKELYPKARIINDGANHSRSAVQDNIQRAMSTVGAAKRARALRMVESTPPPVHSN